MEIWIDVIGFDGTYQCSTEGRIKSVDRFVNSRGGSKRLCKETMLKIKTSTRGYSIVGLSKNGIIKWFALSRLVYQSFKGLTNLQIDHINEIKTDNRLVNLQPLSVYDNNIKSKRHNKTSKYPGVHWYTGGRGSWKAQIGIKGKKIGLGYFKIEEEAYAAYLKAKPI